jgi:uncharacterized protein (DUF58 family)
MRYTYLGLALMALSCVLYLEAYLFENLVPAFIGLGIIVYVIYDKLAFERQMRVQELEVRREVMEGMLFAAKPFTVLTRIRNKGGPVRMSLEDHLPGGFEVRTGSNKGQMDLNTGEVAKLKYTAEAAKRGYYGFAGVKVTFKDRAGLFVTDSWVEAQTQLRVHSSREELNKARTIAKREHMEMLGKSPERWSRTREFEFEGIRDYVPGDRFRDIDWKGFSRLQRLVTKVYERETMVPTTIMVDCGRSMRVASDGGSKLDHAIRLSIQLSRVLLSGYHPTGMVAFDELGVVSELKPDVVRGQYDKLLRALLQVPDEIRSGQVAQPFGPVAAPEGGDTLVKVVSSFVGAKDGRPRGVVGAEGVVREAITKGGKGQMFLIISDLESNGESVARAAALAKAHGHRAILASPVSSWYGADRKGLTIESLEGAYQGYMGKLHTLARLRRMGVIVIELGPKDEAASVARHVRRMSA